MPEARQPLAEADQIQRIEQDLAREFADVDRRTLAAVAKEAFARYDGAKIRDFAPVLAWRDARERLRQQRASAAAS